MNEKIIEEAMMVAWRYEHKIPEGVRMEMIPHDLSFKQAMARIDKERSQGLIMATQEQEQLKRARARRATIRVWRLVGGIGLSIVAFMVGLIAWPWCVAAIVTVMVIDILDIEG